MKKAKAKEQIDLILEGFDFKKVHIGMTAVDWKWKFENGIRVPTYQELQHNAKIQLEKVAASEDDTAIFSLGGFEASKQDNVLQLRFIFALSNPLGLLLNS